MKKCGIVVLTVCLAMSVDICLAEVDQATQDLIAAVYQNSPAAVQSALYAGADVNALVDETTPLLIELLNQRTWLLQQKKKVENRLYAIMGVSFATPILTGIYSWYRGVPVMDQGDIAKKLARIKAKTQGYGDKAAEDEGLPGGLVSVTVALPQTTPASSTNWGSMLCWKFFEASVVGLIGYKLYQSRQISRNFEIFTTLLNRPDINVQATDAQGRTVSDVAFAAEDREIMFCVGRWTLMHAKK